MPPHPEACFHCAAPIVPGADHTVRIDGSARAMCCAGCAAIAQTIVDAGLSSYYRHRSAPAQPRREAVPELLRPAPADAEWVGELAAGEREGVLLVEGMTCAACAWLIEQRLCRIEGVRGASVNFAARRVRVQWNAARVELGALLRTITALGYQAQRFDSVRAERARRAEHRKMLWQVFVSGLASMQIMMYSIPVYMSDGDMSAEITALLHWAGLILTVPVLLFSCSGFFRGAWRDLRARQLGMDVPVAIGILTAFVPSAWATFTGAGAVYFDAVSMFVFLLLGGRYAEMLARAGAGDAVERLAQRMPARAQRLTAYPGNWATEQVSPAQLRPGELILVQPGEAIAADGVVVEGESEVDESLLTGEALPVVKRKGAALVAGAVNRLNVMVVRVTQVGANSTIALLTRLLERALAEKPRMVLLAQRAASWFVAGILLLALCVFLWWARIDPGKAVWITVAVLVVSCPCALSLATPAALAAATNAAARRGVLITRAHALETVARLSYMLFDKTGTLTHARLQISQVRPLGELSAQDSLAMAALIETGSEHPIAQAIRAAAPSLSLPHTLSNVEASAGAGVQAQVDGMTVRLGRIDYVAALHGQVPPDYAGALGETIVALGDERGWLALFVLRDTLRAQAPESVRRLCALGCECVLLSGDAPGAVRDSAQRVGIVDYAAAQSPADKLRRVQQLQQQGVVGMLGDGVNDAPGLAGATLSIAMGSGTALAHSSADVVLLSNRLDDVVWLVELGRRTRRIIRQNLAWAIGYNLLAVPFAALGLVTPWMAGLGMAASSLVVVLNALRLCAPRPVNQGTARVPTLSAAAA